MSITMGNDFRKFWFGLIKVLFEDICFHLWSMFFDFIWYFLGNMFVSCLYNFVIICLMFAFIFFLVGNETSWNHCRQSLLIWVCGYELLKCWVFTKIRKFMISVFRMSTPQNLSNGNIWYRGLIEQDTAQLSSLSNAFVGHQKWWVSYGILKNMFAVFWTFTPNILIVWQKKTDPRKFRRASFLLLIHFPA